MERPCAHPDVLLLWIQLSVGSNYFDLTEAQKWVLAPGTVKMIYRDPEIQRIIVIQHNRLIIWDKNQQ